jgi:hypothetical protein
LPCRRGDPLIAALDRDAVGCNRASNTCRARHNSIWQREYFRAFWECVAACLAPKGRIFLIGNIATDRAEQLDAETPGDWS